MNYFLNLDDAFNPLAAEMVEGDVIIPFEKMTFNAGEPHVKLLLDKVPHPDAEDFTIITMRYNSWVDIGFLQMAVDALRQERFKKLILLIPYLPAARQDRTMNKGEAFGLRVVADTINNMNFEEVIYYDSHSPVTEALIKNATNVNNETFIENILDGFDKPNEVVLVAPDAGAHKKLLTVVKNLNLPNDVLLCTKQRDTTTGRLDKFSIPNDVDLDGRLVLIIDDICDGGATFLGLADELKAKKPAALYLAVTHGIFSKGFLKLSEYFTKIFTTNSCKSYRSKGLTIEIDYI
jgi:ribose-phosphate pyrophosphokinase